MDYEHELYHYGILGMKWGIRRFQNEDGTLTAAGKKRYNESSPTRPGRRVTHVTGDAKSIHRRGSVSRNALDLRDSFLTTISTEKIISNLAPESVTEMIDSLFNGWSKEQIEEFKKRFEKTTGIPFDYVVNSFAVLEAYKANPKKFENKNGIDVDGTYMSKGYLDSLINDAVQVRMQLASFLSNYKEIDLKR